MKKLFLPLLAIAALSVSLISCQTSSPKPVAEKFLNGIMHMNFEEAKSVSDSTTRQLLERAESYMAMIPDSIKAQAKEIKVNIKEVIEDGDKAVVTFNTSKLKEDQTLNLVKTDGKWLVKMSKNEQMPEEEPVMNEAPIDESMPATDSAAMTEPAAAN
jgi:hypothetical protein